jgi:amino acid transporter
VTDLAKPAAESGHLHRSVGLTSLMFISLGSIIGSGWLLGALTAAKAAGGASLISWLLAGVIIILLALVHAELGAAYPLAGGTARFPRLAFGAIAGFTAGWVAWLQAVTIAPI